MCGIAGQFHFRKEPDPTGLESEVSRFLDAMYHRGPDDRGIAVFPKAALGMVRLSIIDLHSGHQPMSDASDRFHIVFNGEIYNYRALRDEMLGAGVAFRTSSDTEVVLNGFVREGARFLDRLEGMFAFAIYDRAKHELFLARDRFGKKPLYYYVDEEKLIFSSETKAFLGAGIPLRIDEQSYWDFLTYRYVPGADCALAPLRKIPAAHFGVVTERGLMTERYWSLPRVDESEVPTGAQETFSRLFGEAVRKRLVADVPVGVVLSGGLDSCAVLYEASRERPIHSYHVQFDAGPGYSELEYAELMAKSVDSPLHTIRAGEPEFLDWLGRMGQLTDEPIADLASIPLRFVSSLASHDLKVALSGEGSDETLAGYGTNQLYLRLKMLETLQKFGLGSDPIVRVLKKLLPGQDRKIEMLRHSVRDWPRSINYNITFQMDQAAKLRLAREDRGLADSARFLKAAYDEVASEDPVNQMLHVSCREWLVENVLMKSDKVSMSASLEVRCPFLDHKLVEFLFRLPGKKKVGFFNGKFQSKVLLRRHLRGKIPQILLDRKKLGFPVPAYALNSRASKEFVFNALNAQDAFYRRVFDGKRVMELFESAVGEGNPRETKLKHFLWSLVVYENWYRERKPYLVD